MFDTRDTWMQTKLYYVANDTVRSVPKTPNRAKAVSNLFFETKREALINLKSILEQRVQDGVCRIMEIEKQIVQEKLK